MKDTMTKIALVTGASRGIGASIAIELAKKKFYTIGTATSDKGAEIISKSFQINNVDGIGMALNVNDNNSINSLIKNIEEKFGDIDVLVNNAGITKDTLLMRMNDSDWDEVIQTNLKSVYKMSQAVIKPMMKKRSGKIINISSVVGHMGNAGQVNYAATKAGITGFSKSLAQELGSRNITVNCVAPGFMNTEMSSSINDDQRKKIYMRTSLKSETNIESVSRTISFITSDSASNITGQTIRVDNGTI